MELATIKRVYFVGIGGIGMSAIARYFSKRGLLVAGYDRTKTLLTSTLEDEQIEISYADNWETIPSPFKEADDQTLIVYTPAIPKSSAILTYFQNQGHALQKRSQVLGLISQGMYCIAVAGTHGKTTTSGMIAHILTASGFGCTAFLGGILTNYQSNVLYGKNDVVVVEADEYDRSFLTLHPDVAVITAMDADHLDIYGDAGQLEESFQLFAGQLKEEGKIFVREGLPVGGITYSASGDHAAMLRAHNIKAEGADFIFDFEDGYTRISKICLSMPGRHNVENAVAAIGVALSLGISPSRIKKALESFKGVKRRFEKIVTTASHIYIDDYAHHPEELKACFEAVRTMYPEKKLTVIFQPHLFSRTKDFAVEFAEVLSKVDELILLEIYPAREMPMEGVSGQWLMDQIRLENKCLLTKEEALEKIDRQRPSLLLTVGAGDIDTLVAPLKKIMSHA